MKAKNEIRKVNRPANVNPTVWNVLKKVANEIWTTYERGSKWNKQVLVSCKEFYEMLLDENGNLILSSQELVRFSQNGHMRSWANELLLEGLNLLGSQEYELAQKKFELHLMIQPNSALVHAKLGECFMGLGKYRSALQHLKNATLINNKQSEYFVLRAEVYSHLDQDEKAMNDLNFALLLNNRNARAYAKRGALYLAKNETKLALTDLKKALALNPGETAYAHMLAETFIRINKFPEAYNVLKKILNENPFDAKAIYHTALVRIKFGIEEHKAEEELLMARSLGYADAEKLLLEHFSPFRKLGFGKAA